MQDLLAFLAMMAVPAIMIAMALRRTGRRQDGSSSGDSGSGDWSDSDGGGGDGGD
ncbi:hypothetical protein BH10PSE8_BH10PSE8_18260 [soil metagenome]|jgi:uncharacterized membrane protein YgcG